MALSDTIKLWKKSEYKEENNTKSLEKVEQESILTNAEVYEVNVPCGIGSRVVEILVPEVFLMKVKKRLYVWIVTGSNINL